MRYSKNNVPMGYKKVVLGVFHNCHHFYKRKRVLFSPIPLPAQRIRVIEIFWDGISQIPRSVTHHRWKVFQAYDTKIWINNNILLFLIIIIFWTLKYEFIIPSMYSNPFLGYNWESTSVSMAQIVKPLSHKPTQTRAHWFNHAKV